MVAVPHYEAQLREFSKSHFCSQCTAGIILARLSQVYSQLSHSLDAFLFPFPNKKASEFLDMHMTTHQMTRFMTRFIALKQLTTSDETMVISYFDQSKGIKKTPLLITPEFPRAALSLHLLRSTSWTGSVWQKLHRYKTSPLVWLLGTNTQQSGMFKIWQLPMPGWIACHHMGCLSTNITMPSLPQSSYLPPILNFQPNSRIRSFLTRAFQSMLLEGAYYPRALVLPQYLHKSITNNINIEVPCPDSNQPFLQHAS